MLQKGVYPYEYMDNWEKFNETSLSEKGDICNHLNMEDIIDADYAHAKKFVNKTFRRISWSICSKQYTIVTWCISKL